jgi:phospholipase C
MASPIKHVVVLMLENRSFDNLLGWLYAKGNKPPYDNVPAGQKFEGLNEIKNGVPWNKKTYWPTNDGSDMTQPCPDPNELYENMYRQMFDPDFDISKPVPDPVTKSATMNGYMVDYETAKDVTKGDEKQIKKIMNCFRPADVPVISQLAHSYAVCDHWYSSVPSQTFANRSFVHAGTSSGHVNNHPAHGVYWVNDTPTIFNRFNEIKHGAPTWHIYYGGKAIFSNAYTLQARLWPYPGHFSPFEKFSEDVRKATDASFPNYVFIEPTLIPGWWGPQTDEHPQAVKWNTGGASNVLWGEYLLAEIFKALTGNEALWKSTMFVVLFDEGGGTYDHFAPEPTKAIPPDTKSGSSGFKFDRYGGRVPAIICSPYTKKATVCNDVFDHTSVIKTVADLFLGNDPKLGARVSGARNLLKLVAEPVARDDLPVLMPRTPPAYDYKMNGDMPLSDMQKAMVQAALDHMARINPPARAAFGERPIGKLADAWDIVRALEAAPPV